MSSIQDTQLNPAPSDSERGEVPVLQLVEVHAGYGRTTVLRDVSVSIAPGTIVALLGSNGAGKTTLLRTAAGLLKPSRGKVLIRGHDVSSQPPNRRVRDGLCLIPEGRGVFRNLTVRDNLSMQIPSWQKDKSIDRAIDAFPILGERLRQTAGSMSGGQQQMLALGRAYLANPTVVMLDEVSMGLAPKVVDEIFTALERLASTGVALLLVEQYVTRALEMADRVVLLGRGRVGFDGPASELDEDRLLHGYLGVRRDELANDNA